MIPNIKDFLAQYAWAGSIIGVIGVVIGFLVGQYWQVVGLRLKRRTVTIQQIMAEKDLYERLQTLQHQASDAIPRYLVLRDQRFSDPQGPVTRESHSKRYELLNAYNAEKAKLVSMISEYNRLEAKLATMEGRKPRWFVLPLPPMAPQNLRIEKVEGLTVRLKWDPSELDPLAIEVEKDLRELFHQYGQKYPEKARENHS